MSEWRIPLSDLAFDEREERAAVQVIRSRWLSAGPEVAVFEGEFARFVGTRHAIAVSSATAALHLALLAAEIGPGDEVIQPAINFVAAANMTVALGARPVLADIGSLAEPTLDPATVASLITPRTRAVVAMHYGGHLCRMGDLLDLCRERRLALIEDAAHAPGARYRSARADGLDGRMAGSLGDVSCFSFFANKNLSTGEGGMLTTDRDDIADTVRNLRSHGMTTLSWDRRRGRTGGYDVTGHGFNYRFDEIRAAIGRVQLAKLESNNERRRELVSVYRQLLSSSPRLILPFLERSSESAHHIFTLVADGPESRDHVVRSLADAGVQTSQHYPCVADFSAFAESAAASVPLSRDYAARTITLPLHPGLKASEVEEICGLVLRAVDSSGDHEPRADSRRS